ncbi:MAG: hypothetical protein ABL867_01560 [Rickettsiales bacterium]
MKQLILLSAVLIMSVIGNVYASESAKDSFDSINNCVKKEDTAGCKDLFTASSFSLYDRFASYGLMNCLPKDSAYVSHKEDGSHVMIRASATDLGKQRFLRLFFVKEEGKWKLDVPYSLSRSMGKNWEKQIEMVEQIYLLMKQQFGSKLDCNIIRNLVKPKK